jgi:uncharacterized protein
MHIAIIKFTIRMPGNQSLKGKRSIVNSLCKKMQHRFSLSVAEVELQNNLKTAVIGLCFVSSSTQVLHKVISQILNYLQENAGNYILDKFEREIIAGF